MSAGLGSTLRKKRAHVHAHACNVLVVPTNVLRIFSYPKFCCLIFSTIKIEEVRFFFTFLGTCLDKTARARAHGHVGHVGHKIRVAPKTHTVPQEKI